MTIWSTISGFLRLFKNIVALSITKYNISKDK